MYVMRMVTERLGRNPLPVIKTWPREALIMGPVGRTGRSRWLIAGHVGRHATPIASWACRSRPSLPRIATINDPQDTLPFDTHTCGGGKCRVRWADRTTPCQCTAAPIPLAREHRGLIVVGWLRLSHDEGAGVAPQPAARTARIGAVVGCGDVEGARDAVG